MHNMKNLGFTIIEFIICLAIGGIALSLYLRINRDNSPDSLTIFYQEHPFISVIILTAICGYNVNSRINKERYLDAGFWSFMLIGSWVFILGGGVNA